MLFRIRPTSRLTSPRATALRGVISIVTNPKPVDAVMVGMS